MPYPEEPTAAVRRELERRVASTVLPYGQMHASGWTLWKRCGHIVAGCAESNGMSLVLLLRKILGMRNRVGSTNNAALGSRTGISEILIFYPLELECSFIF
jgi:hypothetical protein